MCLHQIRINSQTLVKRFQGLRSVIAQPSHFAQVHLSFCIDWVLSDHIFEKFDCLIQVSGDRLPFRNWFCPAQSHIFLSELHKEIWIQFGVEFKADGFFFGLSNMDIQALVIKLDCVLKRLVVSSRDHSFKEIMNRRLLLISHSCFIKQIELELRIFDHVLFDPTVDHSI